MYSRISTAHIACLTARGDALRAKTADKIVRTITRLGSRAPLRRYMLARSLELLQARAAAPGCRHHRSHAPPPAHLPSPRNDTPTHAHPHVYSAPGGPGSAPPATPATPATGASVLDVVFEGLALSGGSGIPAEPSGSGSTPPKQREDQRKQNESQGADAAGSSAARARAAPSVYLAPELFLSLLQLLLQMAHTSPGTTQKGSEKGRPARVGEW